MQGMRGLGRGVFAIGCALAISACAAPYEMIRAAQPNPLLGARTFSLEPLHFDAMIVGEMPVAQYLAAKKPEQQQSFLTDEQAMNGALAAGVIQRAGRLEIVLGPPPNAAVFIIRPIVVHYEPGYYGYVASRPTEGELRVQVLTPDGRLVDELAMRSTIYASLANPSSGDRMREAGDNLGWRISDYLHHRTQHP